jgi:hypothetical protein
LSELVRLEVDEDDDTEETSSNIDDCENGIEKFSENIVYCGNGIEEGNCFACIRCFNGQLLPIHND